jgi:hypothetical protein
LRTSTRAAASPTCPTCYLASPSGGLTDIPSTLRLRKLQHEQKVANPALAPQLGVETDDSLLQGSTLFMVTQTQRIAGAYKSSFCGWS